MEQIFQDIFAPIARSSLEENTFKMTQMYDKQH